MQKSMSISGIDMRSGFRKRSNSSSFCSGSMSVISMQYATSDPAADPRPGPTGMPCSLRVADEVPHDQEVAGELHLLDDVELAVQPRFVFRNAVAQLSLVAASGESPCRAALQILRGTPAQSSCRRCGLRARRTPGTDCRPSSASGCSAPRTPSCALTPAEHAQTGAPSPPPS